MSKRGWFAIVSLLGAYAVCASVALAASPHFTRGGSPACTDTGTQLVCSGELAGLGHQDLVVNLDADAEATFLCGAPGNGNTAKGQNRIPFEASGSQTIQGGSIKNGRTTFSVVAPTTPPAPPSATEAGCPNPHWQVIGLSNVDFANVVLTITQGGLLFTCTYPGEVPDGGTVALSCS